MSEAPAPSRPRRQARLRLSIAAALAVALASSALSRVYDGYGWLPEVLSTVVVVVGAAALARRLGAPAVLQPVLALVALAEWACLISASSTLAYGLVPTRATGTVLHALFSDGLADVDVLAPPVPTNPGLVLLAVLGVGAVAVVVDLIAVGVRRTAVAGLPLLLLFAVPAAVLKGGAGFMPFVLGAVGWLVLLLADDGDRVSRWGTPLSAASRQAGDASLNRVGRRIGAAALGVAVIVPALLPGLNSRLFDSGDGSGFGGSRKVQTYNPLTRLSGQLRLPTPQPLLRYTTDAAPDYLRLTTLDRYDPVKGWSSSDLSASAKKNRLEQGIPVPEGLGAADSGTTSDVSIALTDNLEGLWLPLPLSPQSVAIPGAWLWDARATTAYSNRIKLSQVNAPYVVANRVLAPTVELLRQRQTVPDDIARSYAKPATLTDPVKQLLQRITGKAPTPYDRVVALQSYFRDNPQFRYDVTAPAPGDGVDALEFFLRNKQGFCEQYASAMAALVRGLGLPARVAVGFTAGQPVPSEPGTYQVTSSDAHAWPEVWFEGAGWVRFEPTPRSDQPLSVPAYSASATPTGPQPTATAQPSPLPSSVGAGASDPNALDRAGRDGLPAASSTSAGSGLSPWLLAVPVVVLLLLAPAALAWLRRRRRLHRPDPRSAWRTVLDDARDVGHRWRPADSPRTAAARLLAERSLPAPAAAALARLTGEVERARYARSAAGAPADPAGEQISSRRVPTEVDPERASGLRHDVAAVRAGLWAGSSRPTRLRARLLPSSTLRWASAGLGTAGADLLDRVDGAATALARRMPWTARRAS